MKLLAGSMKRMPAQQAPPRPQTPSRCGWKWHVARRFCLFVLLLLLLPRWAQAMDGPQLTLAKSVSPTTVPAGGRVTYTITLTNSGNAAAEDVTIRDTLPDGFSYRHGTSRVTVNGVTVSTADPSVSGHTLTWSGFHLPSGRSDSFYGIHTFVQRHTEPGYLDYQLNRSTELMGSGAYVTQLFDWIDTSWPGPPNWMRDFVSRAYDRWLTPVVRLAAGRGTYWIKPKPDGDGSYTTWAQAFKRVVDGLPRRDGHWLYVQIWNEPNLNEEWEGEANPAEYGRFLVETAAAIRSIGDPHIVILNGPLSPGGEYYYLNYLEDMLSTVPASLWAFDIWASHPYPNNHPPEYNIHDGTANYQDATIDVYQRELEVLARYGRSGLKVLLTETGYALYQADFIFEGYPAINEAIRADYIRRAFRDHWSQWPEVIGVCPYELVDPDGQWWVWDWLLNDGRSHQQYDAVKAMDKSYSPVSSVLQITFQATAATSARIHYNDVSASAANAPAQSITQAAPVTVYVPTPTRTLTPTQTHTPTASPTATSTTTQTSTPMATATHTPEQTWTPTLTLTVTETLTPSETLTITPTPTDMETATVTATPSPTATQTLTLTPTPSATPSPTASPTATPTATITPSPTAVCTDLIVNGGFETTEAWQIPDTPHPAGHTTTRAHTGQRSMRLGIESGSNIRSYSTAWQAIHVPADASDPVLTFWYYPVSADTEGDDQRALILNEQGDVEEWVFLLRSNAQSWTYKEFSLADYRGQTIRVYFGAFNDGLNGVTAMYVDDVAVLVCGVMPTPTVSPTASVTLTPTPTATPTGSATPLPTPTASPTASATPSSTPTATPSHTATSTATQTDTITPSPTTTEMLPPTNTSTATAEPSLTATVTSSPTPGCTDLIVDGGFEWDDEAWLIPDTAYPAGYTTNQAHSDQRSMRLGIESGDNIYSYSTVRQTVHVPANAQEPILRFWYYHVSGDTEHDLQYVLIENENGDSEWVLRVRSDAQSWTLTEHYLAAGFKGKDVTIYFGVLNDGGGGITAMYVDDVSLPICGVQPTPLPTSSVPRRQALLPLILREFEGQNQQDRASPAGLTAAISSAASVRTLWMPAEPDVSPDFIQGLVLNPTNNLLYAAAGKGIWVLNVQTGQAVAHIPLEATARGLAVDVATNRIYAALWEANALAVIDGSRNVLWKIVPGIPGASGVAVGRDHIYVTATHSDELIVVDGQNCAIIGRIAVGDAPYAVVCDRGRQRVYVGNAGSDTVSIVDGRKGLQLSTVKLGGLGHPHGLAHDPIRDRLYVTYALSPRYRAIAAIDASSGQVLSRLLGNEKRSLFGAYAIAVDPLRGRVYTTTVDELLVLAGRTLRVVESAPGPGPTYAFGLFASPLEERLYVADAQHRRLAVVSR